MTVPATLVSWKPIVEVLASWFRHVVEFLRKRGFTPGLLLLVLAQLLLTTAVLYIGHLQWENRRLEHVAELIERWDALRTDDDVAALLREVTSIDPEVARAWVRGIPYRQNGTEFSCSDSARFQAAAIRVLNFFDSMAYLRSRSYFDEAALTKNFANVQQRNVTALFEFHREYCVRFSCPGWDNLYPPPSTFADGGESLALVAAHR